MNEDDEDDEDETSCTRYSLSKSNRNKDRPVFLWGAASKWYVLWNYHSTWKKKKQNTGPWRCVSFWGRLAVPRCPSSRFVENHGAWKCYIDHYAHFGDLPFQIQVEYCKYLFFLLILTYHFRLLDLRWFEYITTTPRFDCNPNPSSRLFEVSSTSGDTAGVEGCACCHWRTDILVKPIFLILYLVLDI